MKTPEIPMVGSGFTRRNFMKTSALSIGAYYVLCEGKAMAETGDNGSSGTVNNTSATHLQFQLACFGSPEQTAGVISWMEANSGQSLDQASPKSIKVDLESYPNFGDVDFSHLKQLVVNVQGDELPSKTAKYSKLSDVKLVRKKGGIESMYGGEWLKPNDPELPYKKYEDTSTDGADKITAPVSFSVTHMSTTLSITKSGFFIDSLAVTGGNVKKNERNYTTNGGQSSSSQSSAQVSLNASGSAGGNANPATITGSATIANEAKASISSNGSSSTTTEYTNQNGSGSSANYQFNGTSRASMSADVNMSWTIVVQQRIRTTFYKNGVIEEAKTKYTEWSPKMPDQNGGK